MGDKTSDESRHASLTHWVRHHVGCPCTRFADFSLSRGKELLSRIEVLLRKGLSSSLPPVSWLDDADVHGVVACQTKPGNDTIFLAKGSCVSWVTTLVAYVHALSHALCEEKDDRHGFEWQSTVDSIASCLTTQEENLEARHTDCIKESLRVLKVAPISSEWSMSGPAFLSEHEATCRHVTFGLTYAIEDAVRHRRQDANRGETRWRFQDEFDTIDASMQQNGHVEQGSVVELALQLKRDHDPRCKCCSHEAYNPREAKNLAECLADEVLPLYLPVAYPEEPMVRCILSSKPSKGHVDDRGAFRVNLNRVETFSDILRVVVREWARRFVATEYKIKHGVQWNGKYLRAVAGFSTLLISTFPFDGLLRDWFASLDCLRLALIPAPIWPNAMVPLIRLNREGALKVLRERSFDDLTTRDLEESRERDIAVRESAMHAGLEDTCDFEDYEDFLIIRGPTLRRSFLRPSDSSMYEFRVRSVKLDVFRTMTVRGDATVVDMTDCAVNLVSRSAIVPDDPSLYEVRFNDDLLEASDCAADVADSGLQIRVEPIMRQVQVLKGWSKESVLNIEVPSTFTAKDLLEITDIENPALACIVQNECRVLTPVDTVDTAARLRVFEAGYVHFLAFVVIGRQAIRDSIIVEASRVDEPLEQHLIRWRWTYGIQGEIECEGCQVSSSTTVRELADSEHVDWYAPLRVNALASPTEQDIPVHKILVRNPLGEQLKSIKLKSHHTLEKGFQMLCRITGMLPQSAQLTTTDGIPVDPQQRMYGLQLDNDCKELILTRKASPKPTKRKRLGTFPRREHGSTEKRRLGKFAHPRPSASCIVISSDSEDDHDDE